MTDENDKKRVVSSSAKRPGDPQMGAALRSVYQKAVEEAIPDEMLALLSQLD